MTTGATGELLQRCCAGDEKAWGVFFERYTALILSVPRRYGLDNADVEDVFGETCLRIVRALDRLSDPEALPKWLIQIAFRVTCDTLRRRTPKPADLPEIEDGTLPEEALLALEREQVVREALAQLPPRCRKLLGVLYFSPKELSYDEIAKKLGVPRGSLGPTRSRCLEKLRKLVEPRLRVSKGGTRPSLKT